MRLLNTSTLELHSFIGNDTPPYAILSHTWGDDEATFQDAPTFPRLRGRLASSRKSRPPNALDNDDDDDDNLLTRGTSKILAFCAFPRLRGRLASSRQLKPPNALDDDDDDGLLTPGICKILDFCDLAESDGHEWAWADTCCIDKSSSAELSEAINSMYRWYAESESCYVYLSDVRTSSTQPGLLSHDALEKSRWFTRGWTLQELLAPRLLEFYDVDWKTTGTKLHLCSRIAARTGIPESALLEPWNMDFQKFPAGRRFSWVCDRTTTREEDLAYSLMGLLNVNMPLLYGEGGEKAFIRLQQEYLLQREDLSLLLWTSTTSAWRLNPGLRQLSGPGTILARHPIFFRRFQAFVNLDPKTGDFSETPQGFEWANVVTVPHSNEGDPLAITSRGLRVKLLAMRASASFSPGWIAYTSCSVKGTDGQPDRWACIYLKPSKHSLYVKGGTPTVTRRENYTVVMGVRDLKGFKLQEFYLDHRYEKKHTKRTLPWPVENALALREHFDASTLKIRLDIPENAKVGASIFPPELGLINGTSGKYRLTPELLSFPAADARCLSRQIGALVLDIPVPAPPDSTAAIKTVAITFGFTGAGSRSEARSEALRGIHWFLHGSLVWCDIVRILPEARPAEAMEKFLRGLGDRAFSTVLPDPKDKCRCNLGCGMTVWAFVRRQNLGRMEGENVHSFFTIHVVLQDEGNLESQPRWLSSQMNASLFPDAPRDWR